MSSELLFASARPKTLEPKNSLGAKWLRLLDRLDLASTVAGKRTAIKMHLGGGVGFTTIHPFFARKLVEKVRAAGAAEVFVTDSPHAVREAVNRGYTAEVLGCPLLPVAGTTDRYAYTRKIKPPFRSLHEVHLGGEIVDAQALIDFSHVKGHGACGFGGASKNLSMGCVTGQTRTALHALEGGLEWDPRKCTRCRTCVENCPNHAISFSDKGEFGVFYHDCKFCQHCILICPELAISMAGGRFKDFQKGLALATAKVLEGFEPGRTLFINMLLDITLFCDCWGMTTPQLVPNIGILAGRDIVAVEQATLDLIKTKDLIPGALPDGWKMRAGKHLFEKVHRKDPYLLVADLEDLGCGHRTYKMTEVL